MTRAVLYGRVSSDDRGKTGGANLADQLTMCRDFSEQRGYSVVAELAEDDRGASGASLDLTELTRALEMARLGQYDVLVVRELDRLSRDLTKQLLVEQELKAGDVRVEYCLYDFPDTPEGRLNKNLRAMLAEYEREKIKQRMQRGLVRKLKAGEAINRGHPPLGYRNVITNGRAALEIAEPEADTVRLIFQLFLKGDGDGGPMSINALAKYLTELEIPTYADLRGKSDCTKKTMSRRGQWQRSSVWRVLTNETYSGVWRYGRRGWLESDWIPIKVPAIVDRETFDAARARCERNKREAPRNRRWDYLLSGRLRCGGCGRVMSATSRAGAKGSRLNYYVCQASRRGYPCKQGSVHFNGAAIDRLAWRWAAEILTDPGALLANLDRHQGQRAEALLPVRERLSRLEAAIREGEGKARRLLDLYLDGAFEKATLYARKAEGDAEQDRLLAEQDRLRCQLQDHEATRIQLQGILDFSRAISAGLARAADDFPSMRAVIDALDLTGVLSVEDGAKMVTLRCAMGETSRIASSIPSDAGRNPTKLTLQIRLPMGRVGGRFRAGLDQGFGNDRLQVESIPWILEVEDGLS